LPFECLGFKWVFADLNVRLQKQEIYLVLPKGEQIVGDNYTGQTLKFALGILRDISERIV
jgi:hypothetical protein